MKQKHIGMITMLAGLLGMAGALDTGRGWCTSGVLIVAGMILIGMHYTERRKALEKEDDRIAARFLVTFYKPDRSCGRSGRKSL